MIYSYAPSNSTGDLLFSTFLKSKDYLLLIRQLGNEFYPNFSSIEKHSSVDERNLVWDLVFRSKTEPYNAKHLLVIINPYIRSVRTMIVLATLFNPSVAANTINNLLQSNDAGFIVSPTDVKTGLTDFTGNTDMRHLSIGCGDEVVNFSIQYNTLIFGTEKDFERFILSLEPYNLDNLEQKWGYNSYRNASGLNFLLLDDEMDEREELPIEDPFFATVINNNGFVRVGAYLFRVIPERRQIIVSTDFSIAIINQMLEQPYNNKFRLFTFNDDIFSELENGFTTGSNGNSPMAMVVGGCSESKARCLDKCKQPYDSKYCEAPIGNKKFLYRIIASHQYYPSGLWHQLKTEIVHKRRKKPPQLLYWPWPTNLDLSYKMQYKVRCEGSSSQTQLFLTTGPISPQWRWINHKSVTHSYYKGTRALHSYEVYTIWKYLDQCKSSIRETNIQPIFSQP